MGSNHLRAPLQGTALPMSYLGKDERSRSSVISRQGGLHEVPGQMFPCQPLWGTHDLVAESGVEPEDTSGYEPVRAPRLPAKLGTPDRVSTGAIAVMSSRLSIKLRVRRSLGAARGNRTPV